jgi:hypothetical protein
VARRSVVAIEARIAGVREQDRALNESLSMQKVDVKGRCGSHAV